MVSGKHVSNIKEDFNFARHRLPPRTSLCPFCKALIWTDEKLTSGTNNNPKFGFCCLQGSIDIPLLNKIPNELNQLISSQDRCGKDLRTSIRLYNSILAFTSISANVDNSLMSAQTGV